MISVVIPLYNKEELITVTVRSVLSQTFADFELLIVNDGSTDGSLAVVSAISDPRIKVINIENSGVSVARNTGIKAASHDWVAFLDADDWWDHSFLEEMTKAIKSYPEHKLFAGGRSRVFKDVTERYDHPLLPSDGETGTINYYKVISRYLPLINSSNAIIKKSHFESAGYFKPGQQRYEDHDLWMRLAVNEPVAFVNRELSFYRKTEVNTISQGIFKAEEFSAFISTIIKVNGQLSPAERGYFKKYYTRFIFLVYLKYKKHYNKKERDALSDQIRELIGLFRWTLLRTLGLLPLSKVYSLFKKGGK